MVVLKVYLFIYYFFFFQAEDGIRDTSVTGVQTCALPISDVIQTDIPINPQTDTAQFSGLGFAIPSTTITRIVPALIEKRSEERRVGKECRYRWWTYH